MTTIEDIDKELVALQAQLELLEQRKVLLLVRRKELSAMHAVDAKPIHVKSHGLSSQEKVNLFSSLFRGRCDVHALRWENKQGRSGYSIACANEWQKGICDKPRVKCSDCQNRSFLAMDEKGIYEHLSGKQTVGLYPLLPDNNCLLLAVDFDKSDWKIAANAFRKGCVDIGIPCAVERSRSGNGAHVWIFFDGPISAQAARQLGFMILDQAMDSHAKWSFESYDRLFPNQDTMPEGGFGNHKV